VAGGYFKLAYKCKDMQTQVTRVQSNRIEKPIRITEQVWPESTVPLVTVRCITYNHANFIRDAIEGFLMQETTFPLEIIIHDDASTDGTAQIVKEYQAKFPHLFRIILQKENQFSKGNSKPFEDIYASARGEFLAYCEGDDFWISKEKLQKQVEYLENHPGCGMVFSDLNIENITTKKYMSRIRKSDGYIYPLTLSIEQTIGEGCEQTQIARWPWTCTAVVRTKLRQLLAKSDPYLHSKGTFLLGDVQLWAELAVISEITYIPECFATYRILDTSLTNSNNWKKTVIFFESFFKMKLYLCEKHKLSEHIRRNTEVNWIKKSLQLSLIDKNTKLAEEVKRTKRKFTWYHWIMYFRIKYKVIYYGYKLAVRVRDVLLKRMPR